MQSTKANNKISSARIPGAQKKKPAAAVSPSTSSSEVEKSSVAPPEVEAKEASKKVSPPVPAPLALEGWGLASYSSSDDEGDKPKAAAAKKGKATTKGRAPSKDRYLTPAGKNKQPAAAQQDDDKKPKPEPEEFMPGPAAAGLGEFLTSFDPFADAELGGDVEAGGGAASAPRGDVVHLRMQQRNGRKSLTTVQGLSAAYNYAKILRDLKRELHCSGIVVEDEELGSVIQLQGDHRKAVGVFLVRAGMVTKPNLKIHGF